MKQVHTNLGLETLIVRVTTLKFRKRNTSCPNFDNHIDSTIITLPSDNSDRINDAIDKLNEDIDSIVTWTKKFHLNINPGKTQAIILGHKRQTDAVKHLDISPVKRNGIREMREDNKGKKSEKQRVQWSINNAVGVRQRRAVPSKENEKRKAYMELERRRYIRKLGNYNATNSRPEYGWASLRRHVLYVHGSTLLPGQIMRLFIENVLPLKTSQHKQDNRLSEENWRLKTKRKEKFRTPKMEMERYTYKELMNGCKLQRKEEEEEEEEKEETFLF
ncbi:hypothetical protein ANN_02854 [Periplaneta americana]|uniref:Uncharacterized protein n=1 Tax=Periplaneta americana TaxID=6978 RepID=A0ABQ8TXE8_PERAM|nr:hypothetical protein ANN_02854 [Periplaneta americana]